MKELTFLEDDHLYLLDGKRLPCVSDLCRFLHRELYAEAPVWQMEAAAARGTAVHAATVTLEATGTAEIDDALLPYLLAYRQFLADHRPTWLLTEQPLYHPAHLYAGTIDRYGHISDVPTLVDIKTTYTVQKPLCRASLNLYRWLLIARGYPVKKQLIVHLRKDGTYRLVEFPIDDDLPAALLKLHNTLPKRKRKGEPPNV